MRLTDLLTLPFAALWQQKSRTTLTTLGVVFGAFVLAASLSINEGVQQTIDRESRRGDVLRRIDFRPVWSVPAKAEETKKIAVKGKMSQAKRERIRHALAAHNAMNSESQPAALLTSEMLRKLSEIEHVESVEPAVTQYGFAVFQDRSEQTFINSARPRHSVYERQLVAGRFFAEPGEQAAVVSEFLLYRWSIADDKAVEGILGEKLRLEIRSFRREPGIAVYLVKPNGVQTSREEALVVAKLAKQLPKVLDALDLTSEEVALLRQTVKDEPANVQQEYFVELPIVGVIREPSEAERKERRWWEALGDGDVVLAYTTAAEFYFQDPDQRERGVQRATMFVDRVENVKQVFQQVADMGLQGNAAIEHIERERLIWLLVFGGMTCIAAVAMTVAAMGIANTMQMSVLERTREIGIMKAVGASGACIQAIFLIEGALIGLTGGALGLLLAWGAAFPGDAWVRSMVSRDMNIELRESIFVFPFWLVMTVLLFALVVTTLAALYPAWRAARVDPVAALRHE